MKKKYSTVRRVNVKLIAICAGIAVILGVVGYYGVSALSPVNAQGFYGFPVNYFFKTVRNTDGTYAFASQNVKGGKVLPGQGHVSPTILLNKGELASFHLINEEKNEKDVKSFHNLNIDEFNVHTKTLGYFETDTVTFLADQTGTFEYYCSLHPEMKGEIIVR